MTDTFELERTLLSERGVWFYQVPSGQVTSLAPRADAWDVEHPFLTGSLRVLQKGDACFIQLFEPQTDAEAAPTLFAQCPLQISREQMLDVYVHDCVDSSRYFMLRVEDEKSGRRAFVGVGFPDRTAAFNFKATLQDYAKYALRQLEVQQDTKEQTTEQSSPKKPDLSLPEGTTIRIHLKKNGSDDGDKTRTRRSSSGGAVSPTKVPLIPPPPGGSPTSAVKVPAIAPPPAATDVDDEDWGDFTSA
ncbi:Adaptin [Phytophthora megakarya]|uniref:Adaptin n=1 Tax=Phytophthora megakarya TaxID=4795 RepID=A0A225X4N7_9STRA|nr:Adaptin [Phytophthora megakarya]